MARIAGTFWDGIALRRTHAAADPDAEPRALALPAAWDEGPDDDRAAAALAALAPGQGPASLPGVAERWIGRVAAQGTQIGLLDQPGAEALAESLRILLMSRRGAPGAATWRGDARAEPRFVLNLPAFLDNSGSFDSAGYAAAAGIGLQTLEILTAGRATRLRLGFADLAGLLAALDLSYDSKEARAVATCLSALTRGAAECASAALADRLGARGPAALLWPAPPDCVVPGLAAAARRALDDAGATQGLRHAGCFALTPADAAEALLGAESGGLAPAAAATRLAHDDFGAVVEVPTRAARRAGRRAAALLAPVSEAAREAMEAAIRPHLHAATPPVPVRPQPARLVLQTRPQPRAAASARGSIHRVVVSGHRVTLRTTEAPDGSLAEVALGMSKEGAAFRGLLDGFLQAVNIGLARGVPLSDYVTAFAYTRFGPAGLVEGDGEILCATSVLDWAFRRLAIAHLGAESRQVWPDPSEEDCAADAIGTPPSARDAPLLPLDLPAQPSPAARRRSFRLVG
jgi:hypothetical protein